MAAGTEAADSVYRNGNIYTVDEAFSKATALAIKGDRLVYVCLLYTSASPRD